VSKVLVNIAIIVTITATSGLVHAQSLVSTNNIEVSFQNQLLRGAIVRSDFQPSDFLGDYRVPMAGESHSDAYLAAYTARWYGYQVVEVSQAQLALEGAGMAASLGLFVGAIGNTLGLFEEDKTWMLVGAMSALGAAWGASKIDDPNWRVRLRWDELESMTVPTE